MAEPKTPGEALTHATQRLAAQREAARALSQEIAKERAEQDEAAREQVPEVGR